MHHKTRSLQWLCTLWHRLTLVRCFARCFPPFPCWNTAGWAWISSLRFVDLSGNANIGNEGVDLLADELPFWQQAGNPRTRDMESKSQRQMGSSLCGEGDYGYCKAVEAWFGVFSYERSLGFSCHSSSRIWLSWEYWGGCVMLHSHCNLVSLETVVSA